MQHQFARRDFLELFTSAAAASLIGAALRVLQKQTAVAEALDHLIIGASDLDRGVEWFERRAGVRAVTGGSHPGRGTRNALVALGGRQYAEILAPDPGQPANLAAHLRSITEPRVIGWAAASSDVEALGKRIRGMGHEPSAPRPGSRARPDGRVLRWTTLGISSSFAAGGVDPIPFFIQWAGSSAHPSTDSPAGCELSSLEFEHPESEALSDALGRLDLSAAVRQAPSAAIIATLRTPKGTVVFR